MHILLVEEDAQQSKVLRRRFCDEAWTVTEVTSVYDLTLFIGDEARQTPDVAVLDRFLLGVDVISWTSLMLAKWPNVSIFVLSPTGDAKERAKWIERGVADYINKPFDMDELVARMRSVHGRLLRTRLSQRPLPPLNALSHVQLNEDLHDVEVQGKRLGLNRKEYLLARIFIEQPNHVFSRHRLLDQVWSMNFDVESNVVEVTVSHLRKKFLESHSGLRIVSRRHVGYWLEV